MRGLVLGGGGAKGAYQVGVAKALREIGFDYHCITGTSIGAINGAFLASGKLDELQAIWSSLKLSDVINGDTKTLEKIIKLKFKAKDIHQLAQSLKGLVDQNGFDISPFKELIHSRLDEDQIRKSPIDLGIITVSLTNFKPIEVFKDQIPKDLLLDYLIASANLPIFQLQPLEGKLYIDGGFYDNLPINLMASKGVKDIVAVDLGAMGMVRKTENPNLNVRMISPSEDVGLLLEVSPLKSQYNLKMGYFDTQKSFGAYSGRKYYFSPESLEDKINTFLWNFDEKLLDLEAYFPIKGMDPKRALFEKVLPRFANMLKLDPSANYTEICIGIMEEMSSQFKVERLKPYTYSELAQSVEIKREENPVETLGSPIYPIGWSGTFMTQKQKGVLLQKGWEIVKGVFR